jgi:ketosteroid isomerase-like protein
MTVGARTPEELETLLEDAFVLRDQEAVGELFEPGAVLVVDGSCEARGRREIVRAAGAIPSYTADAQRVIQSGDIALVIGGSAISITRRGPDERWRYLVVLV